MRGFNKKSMPLIIVRNTVIVERNFRPLMLRNYFMIGMNKGFIVFLVERMISEIKLRIYIMNLEYCLGSLIFIIIKLCYCIFVPVEFQIFFNKSIIACR